MGEVVRANIIVDGALCRASVLMFKLLFILSVCHVRRANAVAVTSSNMLVCNKFGYFLFFEKKQFCGVVQQFVHSCRNLFQKTVGNAKNAFPLFLWLCTRLLLRYRNTGYLLQPKVSPPQQTSKARIRIRQQGLTLKLKLFIFPPQQQRKRIINKIHVQLQPPFSQPPQPSSLNIPLNMFSPPFPELYSVLYSTSSKSTSQYGFCKKCVTAGFAEKRFQVKTCLTFFACYSIMDGL